MNTASQNQDGKGRRRLGSFVAIALIASTMLLGVGAGPAAAACGDNPFYRNYNGVTVGGYRMGSAAPKLGEGCSDGNVRYTSHTTWHRGQWLSNSGVWTWSSAGSKYLSAGTQSPAVALIDSPISVGRALRIGTANQSGGWGTWWF